MIVPQCTASCGIAERRRAEVSKSLTARTDEASQPQLHPATVKWLSVSGSISARRRFARTLGGGFLKSSERVDYAVVLASAPK